jgi:nicotinic acid mononucleotide adenylyltransferase
MNTSVVMSESPLSHKKPRIEGEQVIPKYPFVDYEHWIHSCENSWDSFIVIPDSPMEEYQAAATDVTSMRPTPLYLSLSGEHGFSKECISAQNSNVAHSPMVTVSGEVGENSTSLYLSGGMEDYIGFRESIPSAIYHPYFGTGLYANALICDVLCNGVHRNPSWYSISWPEPILDASKGEREVQIAIAQTPWMEAPNYRYPWMWELVNRQKIVAAILEALPIIADRGELIVPCRGLVTSTWLAGVLFRLTQIFFKVSVVRSQISPKWDDSFFIVCLGKRGFGKFIERHIKQLKKLLEPFTEDADKWGYSVPPVCFKDSAIVSWLQQVNAQLMGTLRANSPKVHPKEMYPSIEKIASLYRLKRFLFPEESKQLHLVGFYFGSFNPMHENHFALAEYARAELGMDQVFLVPNQDGNTEKKVLPLGTRVEMIERRIWDIDWLHVLIPTSKTYRWEAKAAIAEAKAAELFQESRFTGTAVLLLGQDSWNKAIRGSSRDKTTRHFIGISKISKCRIMIFPRKNEENMCNAPKPIRDLVSVAEGYDDPIDALSSSQIREKIKDGERNIVGLHPAIEEYIVSNNLFK